MTSLGRMYADGLLEGLGYPKGWMANWPPHFDADLGDVGELEYDSDTGITALQGCDNLSRYGVPMGKVERGPKGGPRSFSSGTSSDIEFGVDAKLPKWEWIGNASAGVRASFGKEGGLQAQVAGPQQQKLANLEDLKASLLAAARSGKLRVGQAIIVEIERVDKGVVIASEGREAEFKGTTNASVAPGGVSLVSFAGDLTVKSNTGKAVNQTFPKPFTTAYRVLKVGTKGFWWWKEITIQGVAPMTSTESNAAIEAMVDDDDYFFKFEDGAAAQVQQGT